MNNMDIYLDYVTAQPNSKTKLLAKLWDLHSEQEYGDRNKFQWLNTMYPSFTELFVEYCNAHKINFKDFMKLYKFNKKNIEETRKFVRLKKSNLITIWRAEIDHDEAYSHGHSWTLNKNVAKFFAKRWSNPFVLSELNIKNPNVKIYEATITGDDNFYFCNDREEEEIFLTDPSVVEFCGSEIYESKEN